MPKPPESSDAPLRGIRVADFSRVLAGPSCTRILADLGAEVIKLEPPEGDLSRFLGPRRHGMSGYFMQQNCGKLNVSIDLKQERGKELAARIVEHSDVLVENFRPGVMDGLGFGGEEMLDRHPALVYCSISGYGRTGPWSPRRAFAGVAHASTGMLHRQAQASEQPTADSVLAVGDTVTGLHATVAILSALRERDRTGKGQIIDMAMHDALLSVQECANFYLFDSLGNDTGYLCSWVYPCRDRDIAMPTDPRAHWDKLCEVMARPDLSEDPRYDSLEKRNECLSELEGHIGEWVLSLPDADSVVEALEKAGLPGAAVLRLGEALDCEQTRIRGMTPEVEDRSGRHVRVLNTPYRFSNASAGVRGVPAFRGEDNGIVLSEVLGLDDDEIADLERTGVIGDRLPRARDETSD
jgi:crotonobetainyl-CoA:carnitine CoA-transferase CaiB-like acyl-CoA transferase